MNLQNILNKIMEIASNCELIILENFLNISQVDISIKNDSEIVTKIDLIIQEKIIHFLSMHFPDAKFISEELPDPEKYFLGSGLTFVIDPIDGTSNFVYGIPYCCISIGVAFDGDLIGGAVYAPILKERFYGMKTIGAFYECANNDRINIGLCNSRFGINKNKQVIGSSYPCINYIARKLSKSISTRIFGSIAISACYALIGKLDGFYACVAKIWDIAASVGILNALAPGIVHFSYKKNEREGLCSLIIHRNKDEYELIKKIDECIT